MAIDFNDVMNGYNPCNSCGVYVDDGNFKNSKYLCHDCLDKGEVKQLLKDGDKVRTN